ncbi:MAG: acyl-CoA thioesterase [Myxococcales bacterium]|nr:acyl-CoA thioesterase [Myxococcales bacterium]
MAFECSLPIRFADVDHAGIVYYPRFFHYFHLAFEELFRARLGARAYVELLDRDRVGFPAVHAEADYHAPLRFGDTATIALSVVKLGESSITFRYRVRRDEVACATGTVVCAVVDLDRFRACPIPPKIRALVADLVES